MPRVGVQLHCGCSVDVGGSELSVTGSTDGWLDIWGEDGVWEGGRSGSHSGAVHDVSALVGGGGVVSCGRDGLIRVWSIGGWGGGRGEMKLIATHSPGDLIQNKSMGGGINSIIGGNGHNSASGAPSSLSFVGGCSDGSVVAGACCGDLVFYPGGGGRGRVAVHGGCPEGYTDVAVTTVEASDGIECVRELTVGVGVDGDLYWWCGDKGGRMTVKSGRALCVCALGRGRGGAGGVEGSGGMLVGTEDGCVTLIFPMTDAREAGRWELGGDPAALGIGQHAGEMGGVCSIAAHPSGKFVAVAYEGGAGGVLRIDGAKVEGWRGEERFVFPGGVGRVEGAATGIDWSRCGRFLRIGRLSEWALVWRVGGGGAAALIHSDSKSSWVDRGRGGGDGGVRDAEWDGCRVLLSLDVDGRNGKGREGVVRAVRLGSGGGRVALGGRGGEVWVAHCEECERFESSMRMVSSVSGMCSGEGGQMVTCVCGVAPAVHVVSAVLLLLLSTKSAIVHPCRHPHQPPSSLLFPLLFISSLHLKHSAPCAISRDDAHDLVIWIL